nr:hypothetical protein [uncultured Roseateles sp.]
MTAALWSFEVDHTAPATYLADEILLREILKGGLSPAAVRQSLSEHAAKCPLTLDLVRPDGRALYDQAVPVGDMLLFNWLPVFSERAHQLLLAAGCAAEEFLDCRLRVLSNTPFKVHIPLKSYDAIDFARSAALHSIPLNPPIPFHFVSVYLKPGTWVLPPCFRVPAPGHPQVLAELFSQDALQVAWSGAALKGATFRRLAYSAG